MKGTKEFEELQREFEKQAPKVTRHPVERVDKGEKVPADVFYRHGSTNELFHTFMLGYSFAKYIYQ